MAPVDRLEGTPPAGFAQMVLDTRAAMRWTQEQFARAMGVNVSTVRRWELGLSTPHPSMWRRLSKVRQYKAQDECTRLRALFTAANAEKRAWRAYAFELIKRHNQAVALFGDSSRSRAG